jgi:hypothetical protein
VFPAHDKDHIGRGHIASGDRAGCVVADVDPSFGHDGDGVITRRLSIRRPYARRDNLVEAAKPLLSQAFAQQTRCHRRAA